MNLLPIEARMREILKRIAKQQRPCVDCGAALYIVVHSDGKPTSYTADGVNHTVACPESPRFKKWKAVTG
jgi:hypothetical protein